MFFWYLPLIQQNQRYRKAIFLLDSKIADQERQAKQLKATIDAVQNDPCAADWIHVLRTRTHDASGNLLRSRGQRGLQEQQAGQTTY